MSIIDQKDILYVFPPGQFYEDASVTSMPEGSHMEEFCKWATMREWTYNPEIGKFDTITPTGNACYRMIMWPDGPAHKAAMLRGLRNAALTGNALGFSITW